MKIEKKYAEQLLDDDAYDDETDETVYTFVESSDWIDQGKHQFIDVIFLNPKDNKHYRFSTSRSGSYYTDWYYDMDNWEYIDCEEVKQVETVTREWVKV